MPIYQQGKNTFYVESSLVQSILVYQPEWILVMKGDELFLTFQDHQFYIYLSL